MPPPGIAGRRHLFLRQGDIRRGHAVLEGAAHADVPSLAYKNADYMQWLVHCGE